MRDHAAREHRAGLVGEHRWQRRGRAVALAVGPHLGGAILVARGIVQELAVELARAVLVEVVDQLQARATLRTVRIADTQVVSARDQPDDEPDAHYSSSPSSSFASGSGGRNTRRSTVAIFAWMTSH